VAGVVAADARDLQSAAFRIPHPAGPGPRALETSVVPLSPPASAPDEALERELAQLFVDALNLETPAAEIDVDAPLFGDGLGLDSIDILEVALEISHRYGFQLRSDDEDNQRIFQSLRSLAAHVAQHRQG
jgi:acyl carrier protein